MNYTSWKDNDTFTITVVSIEGYAGVGATVTYVMKDALAPKEFMWHNPGGDNANWVLSKLKVGCSYMITCGGTIRGKQTWMKAESLESDLRVISRTQIESSNVTQKKKENNRVTHKELLASVFGM
jgi:hypothetical protein